MPLESEDGRRISNGTQEPRREQATVDSRASRSITSQTGAEASEESDTVVDSDVKQAEGGVDEGGLGSGPPIDVFMRHPQRSSPSLSCVPGLEPEYMSPQVSIGSHPGAAITSAA